MMLRLTMLAITMAALSLLPGCIELAQGYQAGRNDFMQGYQTGIGFAGGGTAASVDDGSLNLYDSSGHAAIYVATDDDLTIYLWSGKPCAYVAGKDIFGFNGKHLGWLHGGVMYDHEGRVVAAPPKTFVGVVALAPIKAIRQLKPLQSFRQFSPFEPFLQTTTWSPISAQAFVLDGVGY